MINLSPVSRQIACALVIALFIAPLSASSATEPARERNARKLTLHALNEPVRHVLVRVAHDTGVNITIGDGVSGYVTVELHGVSLAQALHAILDPLGAPYQVRNGVFDVERGKDAALASAGSSPVVLPLSTVTAKRAAAVLRPLFPTVSFSELPLFSCKSRLL